MIDPKEVMARYLVEEIWTGAEQYFSAITDPGFHERKPLSSLEDAAELLQEVGLLSRGVRLGPGMRVLDLGAGTACGCPVCSMNGPPGDGLVVLTLLLQTSGPIGRFDCQFSVNPEG